MCAQVKDRVFFGEIDQISSLAVLCSPLRLVRMSGEPAKVFRNWASVRGSDCRSREFPAIFGLKSSLAFEARKRAWLCGQTS